ncbi:macro domain-containing protein [Proteus mirabilis]|uniref:macro domain-containing protein n=2 Tax=Morganellaceae TaxID=1903414 RepID=UPI000F89534F|nr:macro domain-containing protein [Proteus mirabilis]MBS3829589.1 macro domain-containing protein [Proteus mirabilis]MBU5401350.1 macro domain-containing protein [Proteus mirabilis]MCT0072047.1 macro domain-containing protein [Proteus mirabilis]MDF7280342.1 macro domain-containing protein [Proteus mirabilis]MDF7373438.1 macro domain-containing protein [Proteus mirabilis]
MIIYENGNLLQSQAMALVNAVNCQGIMGKGIAYQFKEAFPKNYTIYRDTCKKGELQIGSILIVKENRKLIVNFPTKDNWKKKSQYDFIEKGLQTLKEEIISRGITSIAIPPLGCGNGGLEWKIVESMIINTLSDLDSVDIILFSPPTKETLGDRKDLISVKHLLIHYVFERLVNKYRYTLNTIFYMCNFLTKDNYFNFTIKYGRPYSEELNIAIDELKMIKEKYGENFENFIENYINTHLTKEMEANFKKHIPAINYCTALLNKINSKDDFVIICKLLREISKNNIINYELSTSEKIILENLLKEGIIIKNIFNEFEVVTF